MPRKILIIDNNAINRQLLKNTLCADYDVLEAENAKDALSMLHRHYKKLSAVLLDIVMSEMDGYEVLRRVRDNAVLASIPVIVVTGSEDEASRVKALSLGANDFILKPLNPGIVKHCLKNNIARRETASILNAIQKDKLTGLYNREAFFEKVSRMIADRESGYYILSCFDIDNFKLINEQYGSAEGDRILREIGSAVCENADEIGGIAGRISADNFAALFPADRKDTTILQRILDKTLVSLEQQYVSFSIGRYVVTDRSLPASAIYDRAFIAKQSVKGRYDEHLAYFDDTMLEKLVRDQQITGEMETALKECQFEAWFQPQYNHATGALLGAEALARWRHPQKGIIPPGEFIPLFEQNGFIYELDKYIWRDVCQHMRKWLDQGRTPLPVSVNISRYDIFRADLINVLSGLVEEYGIPVELLRLEITESAFTSSASIIVAIVKQLIALGFIVEIDDFGSGYSSLNTLKDVPAQVVKLDMRFLEGGNGSKRGGNILESIVRMTKWLGMTVIAEGVEEQDQADFLKSIGCTYVQGYLYACPMPASEFEARLDSAVIEQHPLVPREDRILFSDAFWDPKSIDSTMFNKYSGCACVYEFHNGQIEMVRVTDKYIHNVFGPGMSAPDAMKIDWGKHIDEKTAKSFLDAMEESVRTDDEVIGEYVFTGLPGCPNVTYLCLSLRVIAATDDRSLVYCTGINITKQREAELNNAALVGQLRAVMDNVSCGITAITYDEEQSLEYLMINDRYYELLGYTPEQIMEMEAFSFVYEDDRQRVIEAAKHAYADGKPTAVEFRAVKCDGTMIWIRDSMTLTHIAGIDKPVQLSMYYDITAARVAARELLDNIPAGAALYEYDGRDFYIVHINKRYWELMNRAPIDYSEASILESLYPSDRAIIEREVSSAVSQNRDVSCDIRVRYGKNGYCPFHFAGRVVPKEDGRYFISAIYTPISEEAMSIQEMLPIALQAVMDASTDMSFVKGRNLCYISCSHQLALLSGRGSEDALLGKSVFDVFPPEVAARWDAADKAVLKSGKSYIDIETPFQTKEGIRHIQFSRYPLLDSNGNILGVYGIGRDMTEALETKSRLELLTNNIPGGIAIYEGSPDALNKIRLTYFSDGFCRLFGFEREEYEKLAEVDPLGRVYSEDISKMYERVLALVRDGVPMDYVYRARVKDGASKWINVKAVMGEPNGEHLTVNAVFFDVTEQRIALEKLRVSEEVNRLAIQQSRDVVCQYDIATRSISISPNVDPIFGSSLREEDVPYKAVREGGISPETVDVFIGFYESIQRGEKNGDALYQRKSTIGWRWIESHFTTIFSDCGEPVTSVILATDVTESIEKDAAYKKWRQSLLDRAPESYSLFHCNISRNTVLDSREGMLAPKKLSGNMANFSERAKSYARQYVFSEDRERFLSAVDRNVLLSRYAQGIRTDSIDYRETLPDGGMCWFRMTIDLVDAPYSPDVEAYQMFENIDKAKRAELEIIERAEIDALTGVLNRVTFTRKVDEQIRESKPDVQHGLLMLDIDGFKHVNDVFGHGAGDQVLIDVSELLRKCSRRGDIVGRLGGDEFVIFLSNIPSEDDIAKKARQICGLTRKTLSVEVQISVSVGIAIYPQDGDCFDALYKKADATLYYVKGTGKNNYAFYHSDMEMAVSKWQAPAETDAGPVHGGRKRRMLIIDDNKLDSEMLANIFDDKFKIEKASGGASALIKLHHYGSAISAVLRDLFMPGIDGFAVLEKIQKNAETQSIPVVVISAEGNHETTLKAIRAGASDFVTKPINPDILRVRVESAVSKAENERLRAQNSFLELQGSEMRGYKTVLERTGTAVIMHDWVKSAFSYSPLVSEHLFGKYDGRSFWNILLSDLVTDEQTVQKMQKLTHDVASDRSRDSGEMKVQLKTPPGEKHMFDMKVYKQANEIGLTDKLIITLRDIDAEQTRRGKS